MNGYNLEEDIAQFEEKHGTRKYVNDDTIEINEDEVNKSILKWRKNKNSKKDILRN